MPRPKIVILYAAYGEGHIQVSKALQSAFLARGVRDVALINLFAEAHPVLDAMTRYLYVKSCAHTPEIYGWSYYLSNKISHASRFSQWMHSLGTQKLLQVIRKERPDAIIHTFPFLAACEIKKQANLTIPLYTVITDFTLHHRWIHEHTDRYYVASDALRAELLASGEADDKIRVSGIPLRPRFTSLRPVSRMLQELALDPARRTVLIMAGKFGMLGSLRAMTAHLAQQANVQVVMVCGRNEGLRSRMSEAFGRHPHVRITGFVESVEELMTISDLIISKAGGVTLSEALHLNVPVLIYKPLPGQERENARYLERLGAAIIAYSLDEFRAATEQCFASPSLLRDMRMRMERLPKHNAGERIVQEILRELETVRSSELENVY